MTAYASIQFCGANVQARVYQNGPYVMAELKDGASVTMNPQHIRDLAAALDRFEAIAALKVRWETICSSMNEGTWPGSEADALAEIERIKGEIAAIGSTSELIGGAV